MATISYPKTWVAGEILTAADLNAQFQAVLTIANLDASALAPNAVTNSKILDGAVTTTKILDLAVTNAKLAIGAAVHATQGANVTLGLTISNTETVVVTLPAITSRGGRTMIHGAIYGNVTQIDSNTHTAQANLYRDVGPGAGLIFTWKFRYHAVGIGQVFPISMPILFDEVIPSGTYVYSIKLVTDSASAFTGTDPDSAGRVYATELA